MFKELESDEKTNFVLRIGNRLPFAGLICTLLAGVSFVASKILIKKVDTIHPTVNVTIRGFLIMLFYGSISLSKGLKFTGKNRKEFFSLCGRGFFGFIVSVTSYTELWRIPIGDSVTLLLTATVFTPILARIFLDEKFNFINILCLLMTMLGVVLISEPPFLFKFIKLIKLTNSECNVQYGADKLIGIVLTLIAAISFAFSYVILRALKGVHVDLIVTYFGIFNFLGTFIILPIIKPFIDHAETVKWPSTFYEWYYSIGITVASLLGEFFLTTAFQLEKASYIVILRSGDIVIAFIAESIFFNRDWQEVKWNTLIGAALILLAVILTTVYKILSEKLFNNRKDESSLSRQKRKIVKFSNDQKL